MGVVELGGVLEGGRAAVDKAVVGVLGGALVEGGAAVDETVMGVLGGALVRVVVPGEAVT